LLELTDIKVNFGAVNALKGISLHVDEGEIVTLIGANGAGKTTTLRTIAGIVKPKSGKIMFQGKDITNTAAPDVVKLGISLVPEGRRIFSTMTVMENLEMGAYTRNDKEEIKKDYQKVFEKFPRLLERKSQVAGTLSGGEQQMLAIGRALMSRPKLMLLDEPSMGLAPIIVNDIFSIIKDINKGGTTVLLVEQNASMALSCADRAYVIKNGQIEIEGSSADLLNNEEVKNAYLGG
jgi:branched-chain amino acid transport system ATP-binding protein